MRLIIIAWLIRKFIPQALNLVEAYPLIAAVDSRLSVGLDLFVRTTPPDGDGDDQEEIDEEMAEIEENMLSITAPPHIKMLN